MIAVVLLLSFLWVAAAPVQAQDNQESRFLQRVRQLTFEGKRSGEGYYAPDGREQLLDLEQDPGETRELSSVPEQGETLRTWRRRMIDHLARRGEPFVVRGDLGVRPKPTLHSPHYPKQTG